MGMSDLCGLSDEAESIATIHAALDGLSSSSSDDGYDSSLRERESRKVP